MRKNNVLVIKGKGLVKHERKEYFKAMKGNASDFFVPTNPSKCFSK